MFTNTCTQKYTQMLTNTYRHTNTCTQTHMQTHVHAHAQTQALMHTFPLLLLIFQSPEQMPLLTGSPPENLR